MEKCKHCYQTSDNCPCAKVDTFFNDSFHLLYGTHTSRYSFRRFYYVVPKLVDKAPPKPFN